MKPETHNIDAAGLFLQGGKFYEMQGVLFCDTPLHTYRYVDNTRWELVE